MMGTSGKSYGLFMRRLPILLAVASMSVFQQGFAQAPNWSVNPSGFQYSMSVVTFLNLDGKLLTDPADRVGAFVGGQVRGVAAPIFVSAADRHLAYLTIYANTENEVVEFRLYDHASNKTVTAPQTINFKIDGQVGDVFQAVSAASPALKKGAELLSFGFSEVTPVVTTVTAAGIELTLEYDQPLDALKPVFTVSPGAKVYIGRSLQVSGTAITDFSVPVVYSVLSEDESTLKDYTVTVKQRAFTDNPFSCTNVITANGDGLNDTWVVQETFKYRDYRFQVSDVNGRILFESVGYDNTWDGYYKGSKLDRGQYYYSVTGPGSVDVIRGSILVIH